MIIYFGKFSLLFLCVQFAMLFGVNDHTSDSVSNKMEETLDVIRQVNEQLKDAVSIPNSRSFL